MQFITNWEREETGEPIQADFCLYVKKDKPKKLCTIDSRKYVEPIKDANWFRCSECCKIFVYDCLEKLTRSRIKLIVSESRFHSNFLLICKGCWFDMKGQWAQEEVNRALEACAHARGLCIEELKEAEEA